MILHLGTITTFIKKIQNTVYNNNLNVVEYVGKIIKLVNDNAECDITVYELCVHE